MKEYDWSDDFELLTVGFAAVLFLLGMAGVTSKRPITIGFVTFSSVIVVVSLVSLAQLTFS